MMHAPRRDLIANSEDGGTMIPPPESSSMLLFTHCRGEFAVVLRLPMQNQLREKVGIVRAMQMAVITLDISGDSRQLAIELFQHVERRTVPAKPQPKIAERGIVGAQMRIVGMVFVIRRRCASVRVLIRDSTGAWFMIGLLGSQVKELAWSIEVAIDLQ
jgi:hypothetical protein